MIKHVVHDCSLNEKIKLSLGEPLIPTARIEALLPISYTLSDAFYLPIISVFINYGNFGF